MDEAVNDEDEGDSEEGDRTLRRELAAVLLPRGRSTRTVVMAGTGRPEGPPASNAARTPGDFAAARLRRACCSRASTFLQLSQIPIVVQLTCCLQIMHDDGLADDDAEADDAAEEDDGLADDDLADDDADADADDDAEGDNPEAPPSTKRTS